MSIAKVLTAQPGPLKAQLVDVETDVSNGLFSFIIVGLPNKEIDEATHRVAAAIKNTNLPSPKSENRKIVASLSPANINKSGTHFDLPLAVSYLKATNQIQLNSDFESSIFVGELSLSGEVLPVTGVLSISMLAKELGIKNIFVPEKNKFECALVSGINIYPVKSLRQLVDFFSKKIEIEKQEYIENVCEEMNGETDPFTLVRGQELAKRALLIAACGGHNIALYGPPGTGKTMLAKAFSGILPKLSREAMLEVTSIHSYSGVLENNLVTFAPFRSPHHSASNVALVGGGAKLRPGEITLAHRGVLFLDEFPEFKRDVVESLRQPLEDGEVVVSRAKGSVKYPARVILVAAMNPCPCGYRGGQIRECICKENDIARYERKVSGPIVDRIDLWVEVSHIAYEDLSGKVSDTVKINKAENTKSKVLEVRKVQQKRYGNDILNAHIKAKEIEEYIILDKQVENILNDLSRKFELSPRSYYRMKKIARTIADISGSPKIEIPHVLEAFQYRPKIKDQ